MESRPDKVIGNSFREIEGLVERVWSLLYDRNCFVGPSTMRRGIMINDRGTNIVVFNVSWIYKIYNRSQMEKWGRVEYGVDVTYGDREEKRRLNRLIVKRRRKVQNIYN